ncbi:unnamed protein product [Allacma fusca]|uniref:Uncharacterized protein n=1 Tax=Allacma fusca TaxID=39272 RepID=A0A8J2JBI2_9HEXA|nr:unnamed protein product [Allacma fusca]
MAPKCPVVAVTSAETDQTESIFIRLLFEAAGPLILILVIRVLRYLTHKPKVHEHPDDNATGKCLLRNSPSRLYAAAGPC